MKKIMSAVAVLGIAGAALAFTSKTTQFQVLQCRASDNTCQQLTVNAIGVGNSIEGNSTFDATLIGQDCNLSDNCDQTFQVQVEH